MHGQTAATSSPLQLASVAAPFGMPSTTTVLPDEPSFSTSLSPIAGVGEGAEGLGQSVGAPANPAKNPVAPKYAPSILPNQGAVPLTAGNKFVFSLKDASSPFSLLGDVISATYSQGIDSAPHYGQGWAPYGQRIGASAAHGAVESIATKGILDGVFHDDPRYYVEGRQHAFVGRVIYAATRVVVVRSDGGTNRLNIPLLAGYAVAAGVNNAYFPQVDRTGSQTAKSYAGSLGGAALGFEVSEFIGDALRVVHHSHN